MACTTRALKDFIMDKILKTFSTLAFMKQISTLHPVEIDVEVFVSLMTQSRQLKRNFQILKSH